MFGDSFQSSVKKSARFIPVSVLLFYLLMSGCAGPSCEDRRIDCREECRQTYQSDLGSRKLCIRECEWNYGKCRD